MSMCEVNRRRYMMTDDEYWADVYPETNESPDDEDLTDLTPITAYTPCSVCGEVGPCGFDSEGRPLIHAETLEGER